ncbi:MAG: hypothetical protein HYV60_24815, partial [Planctomycetia bacterium]|nr:hypothetical protein [Planctomycetia bacterium]
MSDDVSRTESPDSSPRDSTRRHFFEIASYVLGALAGIGPALIGLYAFLDPRLRTPAKPELYKERAGNGGSGFIRIASMDALSLSAPQRFPVID